MNFAQTMIVFAILGIVSLSFYMVYVLTFDPIWFWFSLPPLFIAFALMIKSSRKAMKGDYMNEKKGKKFGTGRWDWR